MKTIKITLTILLFTCLNSFAQRIETTPGILNLAYLNSLTKAVGTEANNKGIQFDDESAPVYDHNFKRLKGNEVTQKLMSGSFTPELYLGKDKEIKVIILKPSTIAYKAALDNYNALQRGSANIVGKDALPFDAKDIDGNVLTLDNLEGKIIVISFWSTTFQPSIDLIPAFNRLVNKYQDDNIVFIGFCMSSTDEISAFLKTSALLSHIVPNSKDLAAAYQLQGASAYAVTNQNSKIVFASSSFTPSAVNEVEAALKKTLKNK